MCKFLSIRINYFAGDPEDKEMATGLHKVSDVYCINCGAYLGWTYLKAYEAD